MLCNPQHRLAVSIKFGPIRGSAVGAGTSDVAVARGYGYVAGGFSGLRVANVSDPANPTEVGLVDTPRMACGVVVGQAILNKCMIRSPLASPAAR